MVTAQMILLAPECLPFGGTVNFGQASYCFLMKTFQCKSLHSVSRLLGKQTCNERFVRLVLKSAGLCSQTANLLCRFSRKKVSFCFKNTKECSLARRQYLRWLCKAAEDLISKDFGLTLCWILGWISWILPTKTFHHTIIDAAIEPRGMHLHCRRFDCRIHDRIDSSRVSYVLVPNGAPVTGWQ